MSPIFVSYKCKANSGECTISCHVVYLRTLNPWGCGAACVYWIRWASDGWEQGKIARTNLTRCTKNDVNGCEWEWMTKEGSRELSENLRRYGRWGLVLGKSSRRRFPRFFSKLLEFTHEIPILKAHLHYKTVYPLWTLHVRRGPKRAILSYSSLQKFIYHLLNIIPVPLNDISTH